MDHREELPAMSTVPKGKQFPMDPKENSWFLRIDVTPHVLWKFENNKWRKFNYGGRFQWTGTDKHKADFINNREEISPGIPSKQTSADTLKPNIDD
jgi:CCR4-NOT transcriptional regulation complex NOT5 subunit